VSETENLDDIYFRALRFKRENNSIENFFSLEWWPETSQNCTLYTVLVSRHLFPRAFSLNFVSFLSFIIFKIKKSHEKHKRAEFFSGKEVNIICALTENLRLATAYTTKFFPRNFISIFFYNWPRNLNIIRVPQVVLISLWRCFCMQNSSANRGIFNSYAN